MSRTTRWAASVSLARVSLRGDFPWTRVPGYWAAQIAGAIVAAAVLRAMFGTIGHLGATMPSTGDTRAVIVEALLTLLLITVIIGTAAGHKLVGHNAPLAGKQRAQRCAAAAASQGSASVGPPPQGAPGAVRSLVSVSYPHPPPGLPPAPGMLACVLILVRGPR